MKALAAALVVLMSATPLATVAQTPDVQPQDQAAFNTCLRALSPAAAALGITASTFNSQASTLVPEMGVLELLDAQPEFTTPIWDYLAALVDTRRIRDGQAMLAAHRPLLARVATQYGVDAETVVAVWGVESDYGKTFGKRPLLQSLGTLSCFGRRQQFFRGEFFATLKLLQSGDLKSDGLTGSWAGAFGHTQFMPTTYQRIAVDGDGDGRRDLVGSIPDALASTANYLKKA
ncbi:MAG: lytic murein transglycosylase, partial [Thermomonas sp.]